MDKHRPQNNKIAFVLGNGTSRSHVDVNLLKSHGTVFGCNAIYREYKPNYLIAVDVKMVNEIIESEYHKNNIVWTNPNKGVSTRENINFFNPHKGWSSGPTALWLASQIGFKTIYMLGFDFAGTNGKFNNVYADTFNYKKSNDSATFHGNWLSQTEKVINENKSIHFYRVIHPASFLPPQLNAKYHTNFQHIQYTDFDKTFCS